MFTFISDSYHLLAIYSRFLIKKTLFTTKILVITSALFIRFTLTDQPLTCLF